MHGLGQAMDTMDFMKRAWSHFKVPTSFTPTMDVEELDKRITDLRTVEQWLTMNLSLLRNTIQAMELQRATLGALQTMASNFEEAMRAPSSSAGDNADDRSDSPFGSHRDSGRSGQDDDNATRERSGSRAADAGEEPSTLPGLGAMAGFPASPFSFVNAFPFVTSREKPADGSEAPGEPSNELHHAEPDDLGLDFDEEDDDIEMPPDNAQPAAHASAPTDAEPPEVPSGRADDDAAASTGPAGAAAGTAPGPDPMAWWHLLQSSFQQIASAAVASQSAATSRASAAMQRVREASTIAPGLGPAAGFGQSLAAQATGEDGSADDPAGPARGRRSRASASGKDGQGAGSKASKTVRAAKGRKAAAGKAGASKTGADKTSTSKTGTSRTAASKAGARWKAGGEADSTEPPSTQADRGTSRRGRQ